MGTEWASDASAVAGSGRRAVAQEIAEEASERLARKTPVVIGENMERVRKYATLRGYKTINDFVPQAEWRGLQLYLGGGKAGVDAMKALNRDWIRRMIREGWKIVDIGPDPTRTTRSEFYLLELEELAKVKYPYYKRVFGKRGVKGIDY